MNNTTAQNVVDRLNALRQYEILDTPPEQAFDDITQLASFICDTPISLISLLDDKRQWFKSKVGLSATETPIEHAFCAHAILEPDVFVVRDATQDPRFVENPLVTSAPFIRFYAGAPLISPDGVALGTLCAIDSRPRELTDKQLNALSALARQTIVQLELRRTNAELDSRAEERVRELEQAKIELRQLSHAVEQCATSIMVTDTDGNIQYVNPAITRATGYSKEELIGDSPSIMKSGYTSAEEWAELWRTIKSGGKWHGEFQNRRKDGEPFWEMASISPVKSPDGEITHFLVINDDITELKVTQERLQQSQKMEAVGQLTGGIAHDFNNLLAVILGNLELLERGVGEEPRVQKRLKAAIDATLRGADLTQRLLAFSRRQTLEPKVVDINELVNGMHELLHRTLGEIVELETIQAADLGPTLVDPAQLESALLNLAINARDAMPKGGKLTIETARVWLDEAYTANHPYVTPSQYVMAAVTDTGTGMPLEVVEKVFDPFFTTKEVGKGTGLGLSMVYGFVKQSKGHVRIYSEVGRGTTVKIYLPERGGPRGESDERPLSETVHKGAETILVVEDDSATF